jgi:hypothetical protein
MNASLPLTYDYQSDGSIVIRTAQGNHYAKTFDPSAAQLIVAGPEMLSALRLGLERLEHHTFQTETLADTKALLSIRAAIQQATNP